MTHPSTSIHQYCGACFEQFSADDTFCPRCGASAETLSYRDYREKLLQALNHPLADVRMRAIIAMGLRGDRQAVEALFACAMNSPTDLPQGLAIVHSLEAILSGTGDCEVLQRLAAEHPAHAIQVAALKAFNRIR